MNEREIKLTDNPFSNAWLPSRILFRPLSSLMKKGYRNYLTEEDLFKPLETDKAETLTEQLNRKWRPGKSLFTILTGLWFFQFIKLSFISAFEETLRIGLPVLIGEVLKYFEENGIGFWLAFIYSTVFVIGIFIAAFCHHFYNYRAIQEGIRVRNACIGLLYKRCFNLKLSDLGENSGKIMILLNNDSVKIETMINNMPYFVTAPTELFFVIWFLTQKVDVRFLAGVIFLLCFIPIQLFLGYLMVLVGKKLGEKSDSRAGFMDGILNGIGVIKMYCWEIPFKKQIEKIRRKELKYQSLIHAITAIGSSIENDFYTVVTFLSVLFLFVFTDIPLKAEYIVYAIGFYSRLCIVLGAFFNKAIIDTSYGLVSLRRFDKFLNVNMVSSTPRVKCANPRIKVTDLCAKWTDDNPFKLKDINLDMNAPGLVAVLGKVNSGKSSLLLAILNEMNNERGRVKVDGTVSYVYQKPWLFPGTIKQNILFGNEYDKRKLDRVLRQSCLYEELTNTRLFPQGLKTHVAEKGLNLSGGQRARVDLARALYNDSQIYLFDDPLSAVDAAVARKLYSCIKNDLNDKLRILVTHQSSHVRDADMIIIMDEGRFIASGTYQELSEDKQYADYFSSRKEENNEFVDESELQMTNIPGCSNDFRRKILTLSQEEQKENIPNGVSVSKDSLYLSYPLLAIDENDEGINEGAISSSTYFDFLSRNGYLLFGLFSIFLFAFTQLIIVSADLYISKWANYEEILHRRQGNLYSNSTRLLSSQNDSSIWNRVDHHFVESNRSEKLFIYSAIIVFAVTMMFFRSFTYYTFCIVTSFKYHQNLLNSVMSTSMSFFETNPTGRLLNRFTRDIRSIDDYLPMALFEVLQTLAMVSSIVVLVSIINYWMILIILPLCILCWYLRRYSLKSSTHLKRLDGKYKSPILDHVGNTIQGMSTIRACKREETLEREFFYHADLSTSTTLAYVGAQRWFRLRLDFIAGVYSMIAIYFCLFGKSYLHITPANIGLLLAYILNFASTFQWTVCQSCVVENLMTSVERLVEYIEQPSEPYNSGHLASDDWPRHGKIEFQGVSLRFRQTQALNNLSFKIKPGEKIGIVGRTGAGKTSIVKMLYRICDANEGTILIDTIDTKLIKLAELRSKLAIIPQEPILFSETIRFNIDPLKKYTDNEIWNALEAVQLKAHVEDMDGQLNSKFTKDGNNFSVGQSQLLCLARAILKKSKIILIDEATANVDSKTDGQVQEAIKRYFKDSTVLTIAHRLDNIVMSDRIMCMDSGRLVDFDTPLNLFNNRESIFSKLVENLHPDKQNEIRRRIFNN